MSQDTKRLEQQPTIQLRSQRQRQWQTFIRNKTAIIGLILAILVGLMALFADDWFIALVQDRKATPLLAPFDPTKQDTRSRLAPPSGEHRMGLDSYGRDTLSRVVFGARVSLAVGICSVLLGGTLGTFMGLAAGYLGKLRLNTAALVVIGVVWGYLYGLITNIWYWTAFIYPLNFKTFLATELNTVWFDTLHAAGNAVFLGVLGTRTIAILRRFKERFSIAIEASS